MRDRILKVILPIILGLTLLYIWQQLGERDLINTALFPTPKQIFYSLLDTDIIFKHIYSSLLRLVISVVIGYVLGFTIAILISNFKSMFFLEDISSFFMSIPGISWAPLFIMTIGFGDKTIIAVGIITAFFPVLYNVLYGLREIDKNLINISRTFECSFLEELIMVKLPAIMNYLTIALKLSFARTWRTIIAVEMIAATMYGLGYMIFDARELFNSSIMFGGIFLSGVIYYLIESLIIKNIELFTVVKWGMRQHS